jgi:aminoglycoside phosphotransferase family enzyme/predicted kinase
MGARMELVSLIDSLSDPEAYPDPKKSVEVRQTHISVVFLVGEHVYKVKKPVNYEFVDFSTLAKRKHFCDEEVRLNRRLAPDVDIGVVPITRSNMRLEIEGTGEVVEWAVKMQRLPDTATLENLVQHDEVSADVLERLARRIAAFHAQAESGPHIAAFGRFSAVAQNALDNFEQSRNHVGTTISNSVFGRSKSLTEQVLECHRRLIESRAECNVPRDTHGDLRLGHVYYFPNREPPHDLVVIDCIEFNERFRYADPISDMAFLVMGLAYQGRRDLAHSFAEAYFSASSDNDGRVLLPFYTSYRAAVRGKVEGIKVARPEMSESDRAVSLSKARGYWLMSLCDLEVPSRRPCLVLVGGLPGTGKSTLARLLAERRGFQVIRSDVVRKELAGIRRHESSSEFGTGIYTADWTERTYAELLRRAEELLFEGRRVLVDANFREEIQRQSFLDAAKSWGVQGVFLCCQAAPEVVRDRLASRRGDASDANWSVYKKAIETWEDFGPKTSARVQIIKTDGSVAQVFADALVPIRQLGLSD